MPEGHDPVSAVLPLQLGSSGDAVRDLQTRLRGGGYLATLETTGIFDETTAGALRAFQDQVGLEVTGVCDRSTWAALVESGYELGDRLLYHRSPMLRGDDVAVVQRRLGRLGFHNGRVDGIFGPDTEAAVVAFQRNTALVTDGVVGPDVIDQLRRLGPEKATTITKALLTERLELLGGSHQLRGTRIAIAEPGTLPALARAVTTRLDAAGALTLAIHHPEGSSQAAEANRFGARCFVGCTTHSESGARLSYYRTEGFESAGGRRLAELLAQILQLHPFPEPVSIRGMRRSVLRETSMPALWCEIGPPSWVVENASSLAGAVAEAVARWVAAPVEDADESG